MKVNGNLLDLYIKAIELARDNHQVVGEKADYYVTIEQLEALVHKTVENSGPFRSNQVDKTKLVSLDCRELGHKWCDGYIKDLPHKEVNRCDCKCHK